MEPHISAARVRTSFHPEGTGGHWHWFDIMTDTAVDMPDGMHTHFFCGHTSTSTDDGHCHEVQGVVGLSADESEQKYSKRVQRQYSHHISRVKLRLSPAIWDMVHKC